MKGLWYPFLAGAAALLVAGLILGPVVFWRSSSSEQIPFGLLLGALSAVVLYAVMRSIAARQH